MGLFDFGKAFWGAAEDVNERGNLRSGMGRDIKDLDELDKYQKDMDRLYELEKKGSFAQILGDNLYGSAQKNLGFGENGQWSLKNLRDAQTDDKSVPTIPDAAKAIPIPKLSPVTATAPGMAPIAAMPQQQQLMMPQIAPSPAMQQIMSAQQQQNMYGQAQPYGGGGLLPMMATPDPNKALNASGGGNKELLMKMLMGG